MALGLWDWGTLVRVRWWVQPAALPHSTSSHCTGLSIDMSSAGTREYGAGREIVSAITACDGEASEAARTATEVIFEVVPLSHLLSIGKRPDQSEYP